MESNYEGEMGSKTIAQTYEFTGFDVVLTLV